uniref:Uncharacterized protein n=1 Tax=Myotis myotis TaxID=51298 RepID=A0A7J7WHZ2_MYOMY|nr:hypothetical protein mMyoMyo1_012135 [Myotis myotis]
MTDNLPQPTPPPDFLGDHLAHMKWQVEQGREAENGGHRILRSPVDLKGVPDDANFNVFLQSREKEHQKIARQLWEEKQVNEELTAQVTHLQIEEVPLQCENSNLQSEIHHLKMNPQMLPELQQDYICNLHRKMAEDMGKELEKGTSFYKKKTTETTFYEKGA